MALNTSQETNKSKTQAPTHSTHRGSAIKNPSIWLCLHFPLIGMECHHHYKADYAGGLIGQHRLLAVNTEALDNGIEAGMSIGTVESLCPQLIFYPLHQEQQQQAMQQLALWAWHFSPVVVIKEQSLLLEVGSCLKLFKGLRKLMAEIEQGLLQQATSQQGLSQQNALQKAYTVNIGIAHTPKAAEHITDLNIPWQHLLSSDYALDSAALKALLGKVSVQQLPFEAKIKQGLEASGLFSLSQLRQLPSSSLSKRFGQKFSLYIEQLWGKQADPQALYQPPPEFYSSQFFLEPIENQQHLMPVIHTMVEQLCHYLTLRQLHCQQLLWTLHQGNGKQQKLTIQFSSAQNNISNFIDLTELKLSQTPSEKAVHTLALSCTEFLPINSTQATDLFQQSNANGSLSELQDKLRVRLGEDALYQPSLSASHIPELSWQQSTPNTSTSKLPIVQNIDGHTIEEPRPKLRPSWLLRSPAPLQIKKGELFWQGPITLLGKPERIGGYWWQTPISRDYFIAQGEQGELLWVFQNKRNQRWFLQGFFG